MNEVDQKAILQAIMDLSKQTAGLSEQMKETEARLMNRMNTLEEKLQETESRLTYSMDKLEQKFDKANAKVAILSDELLETRADVMMLKKVK